VKSLRADKVIDYTKEDFTKTSQTYDIIIFDAVGKSSFSRCKGSLTQKEIYLTAVPTLVILLRQFFFKYYGLQRSAARMPMQKDFGDADKMKLIAVLKVRCRHEMCCCSPGHP
jgi:NADPH:quinone reductase-like Zn-dependent oxidoreductase